MGRFSETGDVISRRKIILFMAVYNSLKKGYGKLLSRQSFEMDAPNQVPNTPEEDVLIQFLGEMGELLTRYAPLYGAGVKLRETTLEGKKAKPPRNHRKMSFYSK